LVPMEGGHTQIPRASKGPARVSGSSVKGDLACLGLGILRPGGLDLPARRRPGREPMSRAGVQGACLGLGILRQGRPRPPSPLAPWERAPCPGPSRVRELALRAGGPV